MSADIFIGLSTELALQGRDVNKQLRSNKVNKSSIRLAENLIIILYLLKYVILKSV